jgi:DNA-binding CsgD family transcriptional regulator
MIKKNKIGTDYYHFATDSNNKSINQVYLANIDLLDRFIVYFHEKVQQSSLLKQAYHWTFDLESHNKIQMTNFGDDIIICDKLDFFRSIDLHKNFEQIQVESVVLSRRQEEILQLIVYGKTIKEISKILKLSPRTVGHYFETIKFKFNVYTKSELISKTIDMNYIKR